MSVSAVEQGASLPYNHGIMEPEKSRRFELPAKYDAALEDTIYKEWEASGLFNPDVCIKAGICAPDAEPFSIVLPPPNVTGTLHIGHAAMLVYEDILVRFARMQGKRALWVPGTDHAAIATQSKVEKIIKDKEGTNRHDLGREEFLNRVNAFAKESHDTIVGQVRKMGASIDWSREAYTLDEARSLAVRTAFKRMYDDGLIYRGNRVVNWDPKGQTVISDDEIIYEERKAKFYTFRYAKDFPIVISTTRPETKVGDTAVAVHPDDPRYSEFVGKEYDAEFCGVAIHIKVIADREVDMAFGTGALGVTPAHSAIDAELAVRHELATVPVIDERARMTVGDERIMGKKTTEAREVIVEWLRAEGLMEKEEEISQNVATAERTGGIIEPLPKLQWFIAVNRTFTLKDSKIPGIPSGSETTLKEMMHKSVQGSAIRIIPERFEKIYFHWIDNLRDWCISRQIWFGHRIPVYYCAAKSNVACEEPIVSIEPIEKCPHCGGAVEQDSDTLDTWFSSGLWTFSTLGWPNETADFKTYHPTSVLETGYDILFFWVARMILMSGYLLGDVPFRSVYLHGLVRDEKGRKMSKSLGNVMDPLDVIAKYNADAVRLALVIGAAPGNDLKLSDDRVRGYRNFTTKIWNAARFVAMQSEHAGTSIELSPEDAAALAEAERVRHEVGGLIEKFELHLAAETAYHYFWHTFADKIIEAAKPRLRSEDAAERAKAYEALDRILRECLVMLHPFVPFVTEAVYRSMPGRGSAFLMTEPWK